MSDHARAAMEDGRWLEAAALYERAAADARGANDIPAMVGASLMAANNFGYAPDAHQALRVAFATLDVLQGSPHAARIPDFVKKLQITFRKQELTQAAAALTARVEQVTAAPSTPLPKFCAGCGKPVNAAEVVRPTPST